MSMAEAIRSGAERFWFLCRPALRRMTGNPGRAALHWMLGSRPCGSLPGEPATAEPWASELPLVSVVIPCFNYGRYLLQALRSLREQTLQDFEVILVDDGSDDPATRRLLVLLERLTSLTVLRQANVGPGAARNAGIAKARGRYVCCLDADDLLAPSYLEKCVVMLEADAGLGLAHSWLQLFGRERRLVKTRDLDPVLLAHVNHLGVSAVFSRSAWAAVGGFSEVRSALYEDWDFWIRLASLGVRGRVIGEALMFYRRHPRSRLGHANRRPRQACRELRLAHREFCANSAWRKSLADGYRRRLVDEPLLNLSRPGQYRRPPVRIFVVCLQRGCDIKQCSRPELEVLIGKATLHLLIEDCAEPPGWLVERAATVYRLSGLLDESQCAAFVSNYFATRDWLGALVVPQAPGAARFLHPQDVVVERGDGPARWDRCQSGRK
ncbi:glycosyltransferase family 2 protein [Pseudomonas sp. RW407]|uniref:glycosyltransferase family A protein n=1 Tax=Pseudomonas sp. JH-2 TaxID=3114998 RepID=UPI000D704D53|nr:glycosyltransferase family A protein [Pseudomonas sp. JH-2]PWU29982.1 glycosyltransferase family 2 protein [Pseudomonas sp. RW407]